MGRRPLGDERMTGAERQANYRARHAKRERLFERLMLAVDAAAADLADSKSNRLTAKTAALIAELASEMHQESEAI